QHDFGVAGHVDFADPGAVVAHGDAPNLDVVFGRNRDIELGRQVVVTAAEGGAIGRERHFIVVGLPSRRLVGGGPDRAASHVAQVDELAVRVARGVSPPAGDGKAAPQAGASSG